MLGGENAQECALGERKCKYSRLFVILVARLPFADLGYNGNLN